MKIKLEQKNSQQDKKLNNYEKDYYESGSCCNAGKL